MLIFKNQIAFLSKMLIAAIMITVVSINPIPAHAATFIRDIDTSFDYAKPSIVNLANSNILSGDKNGYFHPLRTIKRGEMIKIIVEALNVDTSNLPEVPTFSDVPKTHWAFKYVEAGYRQGIVKGVTSTVFGIDRECTREEMATMYVRSLGLTEEELAGKQPYLYLAEMTDRDKVSPWAKENVEFALSTGLMKGTGSNKFDAGKSAERQQVAVVTDRFITNKDSVDQFAKTFTGEMPYPELYNALEEDQRHYKGSVEFNMQINAGDGTNENRFSMTMRSKGVMDTDIGSNLMNFDLDYDVGLKISEDLPLISQQFQVIKLDDKFYAKESGSDSWTIEDETAFKQLGVASVTGEENSEGLIRMYRYSSITKEADSEINGTTATKYTMAFSKEAMKVLMSEMADEQVPVVEEQAAPQLNDVNGSIVVYLDNQNRIIYQKFDLTGSMWDETSETELDMNVMIDISYFNIGQDVVITAPEVAEEQNP